MRFRVGLIILWCGLLFLSALNVALGDQADSGDGANGAAPAASQDEPTDRQDDDRLPPVLPGEEVVTQTGQKMKVWSSSGPVPVNQQPTAQPWGGGGYPYGGPAVIVDGRGFEGRGGGGFVGR